MTLKEESKNDIQELFDELFANELKKKIDEVTSQTSENKQLLEKLNKLSTQNTNIIYDKLSTTSDNLQFMGTTDDWGDETLISFLNQLALFIGNCKHEISSHSKILGESWENETIKQLLDAIDSKTIEIYNSIDSLKNEIIQPEFTKLLKNTQKIEEVITSVNLIQTNLEKQHEELTLLNSNTTQLIELIEQTIQIQTKNNETEKHDYVAFKNSIEQKYLDLVAIIESSEKKTHKKFSTMALILGILSFTNIVLLLTILF